MNEPTKLIPVVLPDDPTPAPARAPMPESLRRVAESLSPVTLDPAALLDDDEPGPLDLSALGDVVDRIATVAATIPTPPVDDRPPELVDLVNHLAATPEPDAAEVEALATLSAAFDADVAAAPTGSGETSLPDLEEAFEGLPQTGITNEQTLSTTSACCSSFDDALVWFSRRVAAAEKAGHVAYRGDFCVVVRRTGLFGQGGTDVHFDVNFSDSDASFEHSHEGQS